MTAKQSQITGTHGRVYKGVSVSLGPDEREWLEGRLAELGVTVANSSHYFRLLMDYDRKHSLIRPTEPLPPPVPRETMTATIKEIEAGLKQPAIPRGKAR